MEKMKWKDVWLKNYNGESGEAKELERFIEKNYKGHKYIPWATMVRLLYLMDDDATIHVSTVSDNGETQNFVFQDVGYVESESSDVKGDSSTGKVTRAIHKSNMVRVECVFLGKVFEDIYPIQDNAYNAPMYFDSNMVNKSIQRAKARVISIATGLAFRLYEEGDLQFEDDSEKKPSLGSPNSPRPATATKVLDITSASTKDQTGDMVTTMSTVKSEIPSELTELITMVKEDKNASTVLLKLNLELVKLYGFSVAVTDSVDELAAKFSKLSNIAMFTKMFKKRLEDSRKVDAK